MALADTRRALARAARLTRGSARLILMRLTLLLTAGLPAFLVALDALLATEARQPWFTAHPGPLPAIPALHLLQSLPAALAPAILLGVVLAVVANLVLSAGAFDLLSRPLKDRPLSIVRPTLEAGARHLWPTARLFALIALLDLAALLGLAAAADAVARAVESTGGAALTAELLVPAAAGLLAGLLAASLGALSHAARALIAIDGQRRVLRAAWRALRLLIRRPLAGLLTFVATTGAAQLLAAAALAGWRQYAPRGGLEFALVGVGWLLTLAAGAWVWHFVHRLFCELWGEDAVEDLRGGGDEPYRVVVWCRGKMGALWRVVRRGEG